jgi:hypothetical protein
MSINKEAESFDDSPKVIVSRPPASMPRSELVAGSSDEFEVLRQANFPGLEKSRYYERAKPQLAILKNDSLFRIKAYVVIWSVTLRNGVLRQWESAFMQDHCMRTESLRHVESKGMRLLTSAHNLSPEEHKRARGVTDLTTLCLSSIESEESVSVHLDSAIYSDGVLEGPDTSGLLSAYRARRNAEHDESKSLLQSIKKGATSQRELHDILSSHSAWNEDIIDGAEAIYWSARRAEARRLLVRLNARGLAHLEACIARRLEYSPVKIKLA